MKGAMNKEKNNMRIIIIIFFMCSLLLVSCHSEDLITYTMETLNIYPTSESLKQEYISQETLINYDEYTLIGSFGFYKGSKHMSEIQSITFSNIAPSVYDECWNANITNTPHIQGYLIGTDVVIVGDYIYANKRCTCMFAAYNTYGDALWSNLTSINGLELLNTSYANDMTMMFAYTKLTEVNGIRQWDVSNVKTFGSMFQGNDHAGDIKIKYLDIGEWDTSSVENMTHIFYGCSLMEYIPVENWDVSNVKIFSHMFADCYSLKNIDFSKWDTSSAESFDGFLNDCRSLTSIDVSNFDTSKCRQFSQMFEYCENLEYITGLETWDVSNASYYAFSETFHGCKKLKEINIGNWVTSPDNTARMFKDCYMIQELDLSGFDMSRNLYEYEMFANCNNLINVILKT